MKTLVAFGAVLVGLVAAGCSSGPEAATRPNVVVIVSDDAGYIDYGFSGNGRIPTPSIDRIADEGVRFGSGYVTASVCSPSRAGLLSGRYQQRFGHEFNLNGQQERNGLGMPTGVTTFAERLREAGYDTAAFGKWHLGSVEGLQPVDQGFDTFRGIWQGSRSYFALEDDTPRGWLRDGRERIDEPEDLYLTDWLGREAGEYVRGRAAGDDAAPFLMFVSFTAPHTPMHAVDEDLGWAEERYPDADRRRRTYAAMTRSLDRAVGEILTALDDTGAARDTLVVFVNDNGGATNNGSDNGPYRGMKGSKWEGGIRVPFAMRWPARIGSGSAFDAPVSTLDIAATAAAAAGASMTDLDGVDLVPFVSGEREGRPHEVLYWRRGVAAAVRDGDWKLIRVEGNAPLLFDLANDPGERTDLAAAQPSRVEDLLGELASWEAGLAEPGWSEGAKWERNQLLKHRMDVSTREQERKYP